MKKLTLSIGLVAAMLSAKAQDTICTYFENKDVYEFNYQNDSIIGTDTQTTRFYTIKVGYREVLCLHLSDKKTKVRKVIITYSDGETVTDILDSKNNVYYSPVGPVEIKVGKPRLAIKL